MPWDLSNLDLGQWVLPVGLLAGGVGIGVLLETYLFARLRSLADRTGWRWDDVVLGSLRGMPLVWSATAGAFAAKAFVEVGEPLSTMIDKTIIVVLGISLTVVAAKASASAIQAWARGASGAVPSTTLLQNVARILVFVVGAFLILQNLGVKVGALVASLGIGGLAVALALQDTLSNLFAGFQIILARQIRAGDFIRLDTGEEGYVTDIQWRNTTIKDRLEDHEVVIPNAKLSNAIVKNFDLPSRPLWVRLDVGVSYGSDLEEVERVTLAAAREVAEEFDLVDGYPDPVLRYQAFSDSAVTLRLRIRVDEYATLFPLRHRMIKGIHARYREEGITIPFPIRTLVAPEGFDVRTRAEGASPPGADEGTGGEG